MHIVFFKLFKRGWSYRSYIFSSIIQENKVSFANSQLGWLWMFIAPLAQAAVLALVLSKVLNAKFPNINSEYSFAVYLLSGTLAWALFVETTTRLTSVFIDHADLIKKISFPRIVLPITVVGSALFNHMILMLCTLFLFIVLGHEITWSLLFLPFALLANLLFSASLGIMLGIFNVFLRDIGKALPVITQFLFWTTPIVYSLEMLPESFQSIIHFNPLYYIVGSYQDILAFSTYPSFLSIGVVTLASLALLFIALFVYKNAGSDLVDAI